jgi:peptidoglycan/xylan/chitin deacetylase (PgdA/CDA1 family)
VIRRLLRRAPIVRNGPRDAAAVALTFDDGPSEWTAPIAEALERHGCLGTFFVLGAAVERSPGSVAALAAAGHELGNHLWSHRDAADLSIAEIRRELERTAAAVKAAANVTPLLVRPPYISAPERVARAARGTVVLRNVDPADWRATSAVQVVEDVLAAVGPGDIVCLHDGVAPNNNGTPSRRPTVEAVAELVPALLARGLRPVTVSELLR